MKCVSCGGKLTIRRGEHPYEALPGTVLRGVEIRRCAKCGETEIAIPRIAELNRVLATAVIEKTGRLAASEVRFLRKYLGWSGQDFARHFDVTPETVSRWEQGKKAMGPTADRLLRLCVAKLAPVESYTVEQLAHVRGDDAKPVRIAARPGREWTASAVAL